MMKKPNAKSLVSMLSHMRPEGGNQQAEFNRQYLKPVFGLPDVSGNYVLSIGENPSIMFCAHHDTVHIDDGIQMVKVKNGFASVPAKSKSNCLGADCATGIWLMLNMIHARIPGLYVVFAGEELGCIGSGDMARANPVFLDDVKACISFDRKGYDSVITHQSGFRTCSDEFAKSLGDAIGLDMKPDDSGSYTDSNEFAGLIAECTNVSVGYFAQHTKAECQDIPFAVSLAKRLIAVDWQSLPIARKPESYRRDIWESDFRGQFDFDDDKTDVSRMARMIEDNPESIAFLLMQLGYSVSDIAEELGFDSGLRYSDVFQ